MTLEGAESRIWYSVRRQRKNKKVTYSKQIMRQYSYYAKIFVRE